MFKALILAFLACVCVRAQAQVVEWVAIVHDPPGTTETRITRTITYSVGKPTVSEPVTGAIGTGRFVEVEGVKMSGTLWCLHQQPGVFLASMAVLIRDLMYTFSPGWINPGATFGQPMQVPGCGSAVDIGPSRIDTTRVTALLVVSQ